MRASGLAWTIFRPQIVLGVALASAMNPVAALGAYAVLSRELPLTQARQLVVDEFERRYLARMLERHGGNITHAARAAGVARRYFRLLRSKKLG